MIIRPAHGIKSIDRPPARSRPSLSDREQTNVSRMTLISKLVPFAVSSIHIFSSGVISVIALTGDGTWRTGPTRHSSLKETSDSSGNASLCFRGK